MLQEISIKNFKSIWDETIELGRVNVFIGENGCGKSNILEAMAFAAASVKFAKFGSEDIFGLGVRVARPNLMQSSFVGKSTQGSIQIGFNYEGLKFEMDLRPEQSDDIFTKWVGTNIVKMTKKELADNSTHIAKSISDIWTVPENTEKRDFLIDFLIYRLEILSLRGISQVSRKEPLGVYGENLDVLLANMTDGEMDELKEYRYVIDWLDDFFIDRDDKLKRNGHKLNRSQSSLYFSDKYMMRQNNVFSSENSNEGVLHLLFYLALLISHKTPRFFAIDNIESCLNPHLCRHLMKVITELAKRNDKQLLVTTHNPAILDGLNLHDDEVRLFEVFRNDDGHTKTRRIKIKPVPEGEKDSRKLSELWMRGLLGAISKNF